MKENSSATEVTIIQPESGWLPLNLREVWKYRDLLLLLIWRDISVRYRQSILGIGWAIFRPLISAMIFTVVFSVLVRVETEVPYPIFAFSALIPWMYFSASLSAVTASVTAQQSVLKKIYFPRVILPVAAVVPGLVEVLIQLIVIALFMLYFGFLPTWKVLTLPFFILLSALTAFSFGLWLTAANVKYRDVGMAVPFFIQIWMYLCPIVYPITLIPKQYLSLYALNPMVGVIEGFRWSLLGTTSPNWHAIFISFVALSVILMGGLFYFRRAESKFADLI